MQGERPPGAPRSPMESHAMQDSVRAALLACVDPRTGTVDESALAKAEFDHNRRIVLAMLDAVPPKQCLHVSAVYCVPSDNGCTAHGSRMIVGRRDDAFYFSGHRQVDPLALWSVDEAADAIAAAMLVVAVVPRVHCYVDGDYLNRASPLYDLLWMPVAAQVLASDPGPDGWTAKAIDDAGALLRALVDATGRRQYAAIEGEHAPYARWGLGRAAVLADALCAHAAYAYKPIVGDADWPRVADVAERLRGMLAWIDAMERTDVIFDRVLKPYQSERIERMFADDPRAALL
ncbi:hypothetical protein pdul_cds_572 [Pandoravirus dulcis]|uniref:Uncharacterized protein n=1 Tax=Pandoravirus dulcis TaxID=1349409 RepID=S4VTE6_9VIRU|nr:hypothetical protein pdul_cds_572 [Pandoravirus dulcis]AGO82690.2 hypothetical protein pdul_cds_572 [Pandoravirus dulcis]